MTHNEIRRRVKWSGVSLVVTIVVSCILCGGLIACSDNKAKFLALAAVTVAAFIAMWLYSPIAVRVTDSELIVEKRIGRKRLALCDIELVEPFVPEPWINQRLFGSGGFCGYWGWFRDPEIGTYFGYYGKPSDCFRVKMKNGRTYVIGCEDGLAVAARLISNLPNANCI